MQLNTVCDLNFDRHFCFSLMRLSKGNLSKRLYRKLIIVIDYCELVNQKDYPITDVVIPNMQSTAFKEIRRKKNLYQLMSKFWLNFSKHNCQKFYNIQQKFCPPNWILSKPIPKTTIMRVKHLLSKLTTALVIRILKKFCVYSKKWLNCEWKNIFAWVCKNQGMSTSIDNNQN